MRNLILICATLLAFAPSAHAYIDPGTGSLILQAILGGVAGAAFVLKLYWGRIKSLFGRKKLSESSNSSPND